MYPYNVAFSSHPGPIEMRTRVQTFLLVCLLCLGIVVGLGLLVEALL